MPEEVTETEAREPVAFKKLPKYPPKNPLAKFIDRYGDEQIVHQPEGRKLAIYRGLTTVPAKLNPAVGILIGRKIKSRRQALGLSLAEVSVRAGMAQGGFPKQVMHAIENAGPGSNRTHGIRMGTLYALAYALECTPVDLMPSLAEVMEFAGIGEAEFKALAT